MLLNPFLNWKKNQHSAIMVQLVHLSECPTHKDISSYKINVNHKKIRFDNYTMKKLQTRFWPIETEFCGGGVQVIFMSSPTLVRLRRTTAKVEVEVEAELGKK